MITRPAFRSLAFAGLGALGLPAVGTTAGPQAPLEFPTESAVVSVDAYVARNDVPVQGLTATDFEVRDNDQLQHVELVSGDAAHLHVVMALDRSQSMAGTPLDRAKASARAFLNALDEADRVTLLAFDYRLDLLAGPAAPKAAALGALEGLAARGPTALRDALYVALELATPVAGRPVVLIFSDGLDALSLVGEADLVAVARASDASVFAIVRDRAGVAALERVCAETGGRALGARSVPQLESAFLEVLSEVKNRYVLRFTPTDTSPGWHALEVRLKPRQRGVELRARRGYERPGQSSGSKQPRLGRQLSGAQ